MKTRLPRDARVYLDSLSFGTRLRCRLWFLLADIFGFWRYPARIDPDPVDFPKGELARYWFYKARKPIVQPVRGSGLEEYFESHRQAGGPLVPDGFSEEQRTTLSAVGDLMNATGTENSGGVFYAEIADLVFGAGISFANLESTLTSGEVIQDDWSSDDAPKINATPAQYDALKGHEGRQYTVLQTANNHILDCGLEGFETTHDVIEADGFRFVGTNRKPEDRDRGLLVTANGIKVGFVAATYGVNCRPYPDGKTWMVNHIGFHKIDVEPDLSLLERQIGWCRSEGCDLVVLALHWGLEHELYPWPNQLETAHSLAESGADVIIGHHAHNMQPYELYRSERDPDRVVPIFYGIGNLSCPMAAPHNVVSQIVNLEIAKGRLNGAEKTLIKGFTVTPVIQVEEFGGDVHRLRIHPLKSRLAAEDDPEAKVFLGRAAAFADKALGSSWRE
jgi:poly-gamma-glutamate capsule biosynthesis protein CapA/YwtB (metallophosphatase superfamily)